MDKKNFTYPTKKIDQDLLVYTKNINKLLKNVIGVSYVDIKDLVHESGLQHLRNGLDNGIEPADFTDTIISNFGFKKIEDLNNTNETKKITSYNLAKANLCDFASKTNGEWILAKDGNIYLTNVEDIVMIEPVISNNGKILFHIYEDENNSLIDFLPKKEVSKTKIIATNHDIGDTIAIYENTLPKKLAFA